MFEKVRLSTVTLADVLPHPASLESCFLILHLSIRAGLDVPLHIRTTEVSMKETGYVKTMKAILRKAALYDLALQFYLFSRKISNALSPRDRWLRIKCAREGSSLPSSELIFTVAGTSDVKWFLRGGSLAAESIHEILRRNKIVPDSLSHILDLGCGCGRVIRHLKPLANAQLYGTDYNPKLIEWCKGNLQFAHFDVNDLRPPLRYGNAKFDLVYALSVFTHLPEDLQLRWMDELRRVIRAGGYLLITTHGRYYLDQMDPTEQAQFQCGQLVVRNSKGAGSNRCAAFHPEKYVRTKLADGFEVLDFIPEGAKGNPMQDAFLLRRKSTEEL